MEQSFAEKEAEQLLCQCTGSEQLNILSLVLSSAGLPHRVAIFGRLFSIYVQRQYLEAAEYQLRAYEEEAKNWPPSPGNLIGDFQPLFQGMAAVVVFVLVIFHRLSGAWQSQSSWFIAGCGDADKVLQQGEWYRLVTALTLHADVGHLLGNCFFAAILLHFFFGITGNGIGLFALLVTGIFANLLNVIGHGGTHLFVGFSTVIFSTVGMLSTISFIPSSIQNENGRKRVMRVLMPLMAGLALLAFLGSSGERTDLGSHLFGLFVGLITGNVVRFRNFSRWRNSFWLQGGLGVLTVVLFIECWNLAGFQLF